MILRAMFFMTLMCLPCFTWAQVDIVPDEVRVDYTALKKNISQVIIDLSKVSEVNITFDPSILPDDKAINISAKNKTLGAILNAILRGTDAKYKIVGSQLVIVKDEFVKAEKLITISGYLRDSLSGEPLVYANIFDQEKTNGTNTNDYGFYSFTLPKGIQRVYYSYLGYKKTILELKLKKDTIVDVFLNPDALLNEVLILDSQVDAQEKELYSADVLPVDKIWSITSLAGESDVYGLVQLMSGVSTGADGFGGFNVRGGSADQNLVLYDGVPVYNSSHALGIFSVFNPNIIKSAKLIKGAFPAKYGGRLSSVLDIRTKEGSTKRTQGDISFGSIAFKGTLEGPLGDSGSSYIVSARRTHLDLWLLKNISNYINDLSGREGELNYHFADVNLKLNLKMGKRNKLIMSYYYGNDVLNNEVSKTVFESDTTVTELNQIDSKWGNNILSLRLNSELTQKLYHNLTLYRSRFTLNSFDLQEFNRENPIDSSRTYTAGLFSSGITDLGFKSDFDYIPSTSHFVRFGLGAVRHSFSPGILNVNQSNGPSGFISKRTLGESLSRPDITGTEIYGYAEDEIRLSKTLRMNLGLRYNLVKTKTLWDGSLEPRLSLLAEGDRFFVKLGASRMSQYLHLLTNGGFGLPTDVWIPSTDRIKPEKSWVFTTGFGIDLTDQLQFEVEGFYKNFDRIVSFSEGSVDAINSSDDWENILPLGSGSAKGIEFNFKKPYGYSNLFINYTLSVSDRQFEDINFGNQFAFRYDRRHQVKFTYLQKLNKNAEFSMNWQISSGSPASIPLFYKVVLDTDGNPIPVPEIDGRNEQRLPAYHRLDLGFNFYNTYSWARQKFSVGLFNAYNRRNPFFIDVGASDSNPNDFQTFQYSILPIFPSISYSLSF